MAVTSQNKTLVPQEELDNIEKLQKRVDDLVGSLENLAKIFGDVAKSAASSSKSSKEYAEMLAKSNKGEEEAVKIETERKNVLTDLEKAESRLEKARSPQAAELSKINEQIRQQNTLNRQSAREALANGNNIEALRARVAKLKSEWTRAEIGSKQFKQLQKDIQSANNELGKLEKQVGVWGRTTWNWPIFDAFKRLATQLVGIGALLRGAVSLVRGSIVLAKDFEQANANLASVLGTTRKEIRGLTEDALYLGRQTQYTSSQVTELQTELAKLGFTEKQIRDSQAAILDFALAVGASLGDAAQLTGATLRSFNLETTETERVVSTLAVATTRSAVDFGYLNSAMSTIAPVANAFNFTIEDTAALLGTLANAGFDASSAATATRNILLNLANSNGKLAKSISQPVRDIKSLTAALVELRDRGIDLAETLDLTDKRSVAAFNTFLQGAENVSELREELTDVNEELSKMVDERTDTTQGAIYRLTSAWDGLRLAVNESNGSLKTFIDVLANAVNAITDRVNPEMAAARKATEEYNESYNDRTNALQNWVNTYIEMGMEVHEAESKALADFQEATQKREQILEQNLADALQRQSEFKKRWAQSKTEALELSSAIDTATRALENFRTGSANALRDYVSLSDRVVEPQKEPRAGDGLTDAERKKLTRERLKQAQNEQKALQQIEQLALKMQADTQKIILSNTKNSYNERLNALREYNAIQVQLLEQQAEAQKQNIIQSLLDNQNNGITTEAQARKAAANQILAIDKQLQAERVSLHRTASNTITQLAEQEAQRLAQIYQNNLSGQLALLDLDELRELQELSSNISPTDLAATERYQAGQEEIIRKYAKKRFEAEQEALLSILELEDLSDTQREAIYQKAGENIVAYAQETANARIREDEKYAEASIRIEEQLRDRKKALLSEFISFAQTSLDSYFQVQLGYLDKTRESEQTHYDERRAQVERFEESGLISKEQAEARKAAIDDQQRAREDEIQRRREEIEQRQFLLQQAFSVAEIYREMNAAIFQIRAQAAILAANPVTAALAARALAQIPIVRLNAAAQIGAIVAQSIPKFAEGTDYHKGGLAVVGDGGRSEMVLLPGGGIIKTPDKPTVMDLPKGTEIKPDWQAALLEAKLNMIMQPSQESPKQPNIYLKQEKLEQLTKQNTQEFRQVRQLSVNILRQMKRNSKYSSIR